MQQHLTPGQSKPLDLRTADGRLVLHVRVDRHHEGISITVITPADTTLNRTFTNDRLDQGRDYLQLLYDEARAGRPVWMIEATAGVLTSTAAVFDDAERDLIDRINTTLDAAAEPRRVESDRLNTDVQAITAGADPNWRAKARQQAAACTDRHDYSRTRVHCKPLTPAELDLIRNHRNGVVTTRPGQSWLILRAIYRRIGGEPTYRPGTRIIASLRLDARKLAIAEQNGVAA